jgi:hypothetical protein
MSRGVIDRCAQVTGFALAMFFVLLTPITRAAADVDLRLGAKALLNLSGDIETGAPPAPYALWYNGAPGVGFGGGLYAELEFERIVSLELDLLFESNRIYFQGTVPLPAAENAYALVDQHVTFGQLRIPLLAKLTPRLSKHVEFTFGVGPELILGLGRSASTSYVANGTTYGAASVFGAAVALDLGFAFYTKRYHIPISLRFAYNVLSSSSYSDRVYASEFAKTYIVDAVESWQLGLVIGFGFLIPPEADPPPPPPPPPPPKSDVDDPFFDPSLAE